MSITERDFVSACAGDQQNVEKKTEATALHNPEQILMTKWIWSSGSAHL